MKQITRWGLAAMSAVFAATAFAASASKAPPPPPPGCDTAKQRCIVDVKITGAPGSYAVTLDPDIVKVPMVARRKPFVIVFRLPNLFVFKPAMGDGVVLKDPDQDEFVDAHVSDDDNGGPPTSPKGWRRFVWKYLNTVDGLYRYKIQFHDTAGNSG